MLSQVLYELSLSIYHFHYSMGPWPVARSGFNLCQLREVWLKGYTLHLTLGRASGYHKTWTLDGEYRDRCLLQLVKLCGEDPARFEAKGLIEETALRTFEPLLKYQIHRIVEQINSQRESWDALKPLPMRAELYSPLAIWLFRIGKGAVLLAVAFGLHAQGASHWYALVVLAFVYGALNLMQRWMSGG